MYVCMYVLCIYYCVYTIVYILLCIYYCVYLYTIAIVFQTFSTYADIAVAVCDARSSPLPPVFNFFYLPAGAHRDSFYEFGP